jgi:hypothetical protein
MFALLMYNIILNYPHSLVCHNYIYSQNNVTCLTKIKFYNLTQLQAYLQILPLVFIISLHFLIFQCLCLSFIPRNNKILYRQHYRMYKLNLNIEQVDEFWALAVIQFESYITQTMALTDTQYYKTFLHSYA